jgi:hypothetical protein
MKKILSIAGLVSALAVIGGIGAWISQAEEDHEQVRSNQEQLKILTDIHEAQATKEAAERELLRKLCLTGKADLVLCKEQGLEVPE